MRVGFDETAGGWYSTATATLRLNILCCIGRRATRFLVNRPWDQHGPPHISKCAPRRSPSWTNGLKTEMEPYLLAAALVSHDVEARPATPPSSACSPGLGSLEPDQSPVPIGLVRSTPMVEAWQKLMRTDHSSLIPSDFLTALRNPLSASLAFFAADCMSVIAISGMPTT